MNNKPKILNAHCSRPLFGGRTKLLEETSSLKHNQPWKEDWRAIQHREALIGQPDKNPDTPAGEAQDAYRHYRKVPIYKDEYVNPNADLPNWKKPYTPPTPKPVEKVYCANTMLYTPKTDAIKIRHIYYKKELGKLGLKYCTYMLHGTRFLALIMGKSITDIISFCGEVAEDEAYETVFGDVSSFHFAETKLEGNGKPYSVRLKTRMIRLSEFTKRMKHNSYTDKSKQGTSKDITLQSAMEILEESAGEIYLQGKFADIAMGLARNTAKRQIDRYASGDYVQVSAYYPNFHTGAGMITHNKMDNVYPLFIEYNRT